MHCNKGSHQPSGVSRQEKLFSAVLRDAAFLVMAVVVSTAKIAFVARNPDSALA